MCYYPLLEENMALYMGQHQWVELDPARCFDLLSQHGCLEHEPGYCQCSQYTANVWITGWTMCSHILLSPFHPWRSGFWGGAWHKPKKRRTKPALWGAGGACGLGFWFYSMMQMEQLWQCFLEVKTVCLSKKDGPKGGSWESNSETDVIKEVLSTWGWENA